jgi:hypothetical protein
MDGRGVGLEVGVLVGGSPGLHDVKKPTDRISMITKIIRWILLQEFILSFL